MVSSAVPSLRSSTQITSLAASAGRKSYCDGARRKAAIAADATGARSSNRYIFSVVDLDVHLFAGKHRKTDQVVRQFFWPSWGVYQEKAVETKDQKQLFQSSNLTHTQVLYHFVGHNTR